MSQNHRQFNQGTNMTDVVLFSHQYSQVSEVLVTRGQFERSIRAFYHRCQVCNQSYAVMDLMMILGNVKINVNLMDFILD